MADKTRSFRSYFLLLLLLLGSEPGTISAQCDAEDLEYLQRKPVFTVSPRVLQQYPDLAPQIEESRRRAQKANSRSLKYACISHEKTTGEWAQLFRSLEKAQVEVEYAQKALRNRFASRYLTVGRFVTENPMQDALDEASAELRRNRDRLEAILQLQGELRKAGVLEAIAEGRKPNITIPSNLPPGEAKSMRQLIDDAVKSDDDATRLRLFKHLQAEFRRLVESASAMVDEFEIDVMSQRTELNHLQIRVINEWEVLLTLQADMAQIAARQAGLLAREFIHRKAKALINSYETGEGLPQ